MLPAHADWGRRAPIWDTDGGGSNRIALFPPLPRAATPPHPTSPHPSPLGFSGPPVAIHRQREFSGKGGGGSGPLLGDLLLGERWLSYLERKTEVEAGATVAWAWTLAPLPLLGAHIQTAAIGSALTVFCVGFGTRPRGKQREFLLRREAARCFQPTRIGMESLKGRTGAETGAYLNSAFGNAKLPGQPFSGRYPRVGVPLKERLQGVLLAQPQNEPPPSRSCGDGPCARRAGRAESQSTRGRTGRRSPSVLPLCLSKAGSPGTGVHLEVTWRHPDSQAERQGWWGHPPPPPTPRRHARNTSRQKGNQTRPQNKGGKKSHPPRVSTRLGGMPGRRLNGAAPRFPSMTMPVGGSLASRG